METKTGADSAPTYSIGVSEPWFSLISLGLKTIEGRKNSGNFAKIQVSDTVEWTNANFGPRKVLTRVVAKRTYPTFEEYLRTEGLGRCLPGIPDLEMGVGVYRTYYSEEDERRNGVVAIELELC